MSAIVNFWSDPPIKRTIVELQADATDIDATINHGFYIPNLDPNRVLFIALEPITPAFYASKWWIKERNATHVVLGKVADPDSGGIEPQIRITITLGG